MYLVVGLCKLWTTFCVNFEPQRFKISVYTASSALRLLGKWLPLRIRGEEKCWLWHSDRRFKDHLLFRTVFAAPRGGLKKAVSTLYTSSNQHHHHLPGLTLYQCFYLISRLSTWNRCYGSNGCACLCSSGINVQKKFYRINYHYTIQPLTVVKHTPIALTVDSSCNVHLFSTG